MKRIFLLALCVALTGCQREEDAADAVQIRSWSLPAHEARQPAPRSVHLGHNGILYALDTIGRIVLMDPEDGAVQDIWWMPAHSVGRPEGLCLLRDGRLAVADTHYHRIVLFRPDGEVDHMFGSEGTAAGEFIYPVAIDEDAEGNLFVAEYGSNDRVQRFRPDGTPLLQFSSFGSEADQLQRPAGLRCRNGKVYVADALNHRIQIFDTNGTHLHFFPANAPTLLYLPYDLALDDSGGILVIEYGNGKVTRLDAAGNPDPTFSRTAAADTQFRTPWGGSFRDGLLIVADTGNRRIVRMTLP